MTKQTLSQMVEAVALAERAYQAGYDDAKNMDAAANDFPLWISTDAQRSDYVDGFARRREEIADAAKVAA